MKLIQLLGKYSSVSQGMNARAYSLKERKQCKWHVLPHLPSVGTNDFSQRL